MRVRTHTNPMAFNHRFEELNYQEMHEPFTGNLDIEIGFGRGVFMQHWAELNPDRLLLGVEVRKQLALLLEERLQNIEAAVKVRVA